MGKVYIYKNPLLVLETRGFFLNEIPMLTLTHNPPPPPPLVPLPTLTRLPNRLYARSVNFLILSICCSFTPSRIFDWPIKDPRILSIVKISLARSLA